MGTLRQHEDSEDNRCVECFSRPSVGPCAACHGMVCGECCTLVTDPDGKRVICLSCTRMVAGVHRSSGLQTKSKSKMTAWMILGVLAFGLLAVLLRA